MSGIASGVRGLGFCAIAGVLLCGVAAVHAQDLQVSLTGWDYGNVIVGTSETVRFDLLAGPPTSAWTYMVLLNETPDYAEPYISPHWGDFTLGAFSFDPLTLGPLPREMPCGEIFPVDVIFTPPGPGYYSVYLGILSNDAYPPPGPQAFFLLEGTGVLATVPVPGALLLGAMGAGAVGWLRRRGALA